MSVFIACLYRIYLHSEYLILNKQNSDTFFPKSAEENMLLRTGVHLKGRLYNMTSTSDRNGMSEDFFGQRIENQFLAGRTGILDCLVSSLKVVGRSMKP